MGHALYRGRRAECLLSPQLELDDAHHVSPCRALLATQHEPCPLWQWGTHLVLSDDGSPFAQAKAGLVTAKTMQRQMGDLQSSPCREEVECHPLSSCTGGTQKPSDLPSSLKSNKAKETAQPSQDSSDVGQGLLEELMWENLPTSQGSSSVWRSSLPDNGPSDGGEWSWT